MVKGFILFYIDVNKENWAQTCNAHQTFYTKSEA